MITVYGNRVLVKERAEEFTTKSGIIVPPVTVRQVFELKQKQAKGLQLDNVTSLTDVMFEVVAVSEDLVYKDIRPGDILKCKQAGFRVYFEGQEYQLVDAYDILAKIN